MLKSRKLRKLLYSIPETYVLNAPQLFHIALLVLCVPWLVGVDSYGIFSAIISLPGIIHSAFEAFCITAISKYKRRDVLLIPVRFVVAPVLLLVIASFFVFL